MGYTLTSATVLASTVVLGPDGAAQAGAAADQAGVQVLPVVAVAEVLTLLGEESIALPGWLEVLRGPPRIESGVQVSDIEIVAMALRGAGRFGLVEATVRDDVASVGELRAQQPAAKFPASSLIDLFVDIDVPASAFGALRLHTAAPLRLVPRQSGQESVLNAWPPLGVTFELDHSTLAGEEPCVLLLGPDGLETEPAVCLRDFTLEFAPLLPSYSVARGGPSALHPADVLALTPVAAADGRQAPFVHRSCANLRLSADGCDDGSDGDQDDLNAFSYGSDFTEPDAGVMFSVGPGALGTTGSGVAEQVACPPLKPGSSPEPDSDVFRSLLDGTNRHIFDGNGPVAACTPAFPLGLVEGLGVRDDLDALEAGAARGSPVYFSLDAASPSLASLGATAADILVTAAGSPAVFASAAELGLRPDDDIDALCLKENDDGAFGAGDALAFSLAPGSPTLGLIGAGAGDLLWPGTSVLILRRSETLGLAAGDDVNALSCRGLIASVVGDGDVDCSGTTDSMDAMLVLQLEARLLDALTCGLQSDVNASGSTNSIDAALILQLAAGKLDGLPV